MTVIAWDGKMLCTDSLGSGNYIVQRKYQKLFVFSQGLYCAIAVSGTYANAFSFIRWIREGGEKPSIAKDDRVDAICIDAQGRAWNYWCDLLDRELCGTVDAGGCGQDFAMGAMLAGASAYQAVQISCRLDPACGGDVQCFDFATKTLTGPFA